MDKKVQNKAIFLDRDGVINKEVNYLYKIEDFVLINGVFESLKHYRESGYIIIVITNQAGVGRGYYSEDDVLKLHKYMNGLFKNNHCFVDKIYYCPHTPDDGCKCRKPKPGMILEAAKEFNIDLKSSWIIGDKESDILAGKNAGIDKTILVRSGHPIDETSTQSSYILDSIYNSIEIIK